jgi:hypothetical protein
MILKFHFLKFFIFKILFLFNLVPFLGVVHFLCVHTPYVCYCSRFSSPDAFTLAPAVPALLFACWCCVCCVMDV